MNANTEYNELWQVVYNEIAPNYTEPVLKIFFAPLNLELLDDEVALFTHPNKAIFDLVNKKYAVDIEKAIENTLGFQVKVYVHHTENFDMERALQEKNNAPAQKEAHAAPVHIQAPEPSEPKEEESGEETAGTNFIADNSYTFENFIVGNSNKLAHAASVAVANHPTAYNPLFLYGAPGLGKTHLMKAIANKIKDTTPSFNIIFVKGEDFTNELIRSIERKNTAEFKDKYRNADMLLIDDIQFIAGKAATQEEFFHTFNALYDAGKQIILTSDRPPKDIQHLEDRIKSRFEGGLIVDIQPPDTELRIAILKRKAQIMNIKLSDEVLTFLGENVKNNIRTLEGVIKKLGAYSFVNGTTITTEIARNVLSGVITGTVSPEVIADQIIDNISKRYRVSIEDIKGKKRTNDIAHARHVSIYVIRQITDLSYTNIGKIFNRDHTTILSSIDVVKGKMAADSAFEYEIDDICNEFKR